MDLTNEEIGLNDGDEQKIVQTLKKRLKKAETQRSELLPEWEACDEMHQVVSRMQRQSGHRAMDSDELLEDFIRDGFGHEEGSLDGPDAEPMSMKAAHCCQFLHSKLIVSEPTVTVTPLNNDQSTRKAADFAGRFTTHYREIVEMDEVLEGGTYLDCVIYGMGAAYIGWDPHIGELVDEGDGEGPQPQGDFVLEAVSPKDIILDTSVTKLSNSNWVIRIKHLTVEEALFSFPQSKVEILDYLKKQRDREDSPTDKYGGGDEKEGYDTVTIYEYWEKKTPWNPEGTYFNFINKDCPKIIGDGIQSHPYAHGELPFWIFTDIDIPDSPYGMSRLVLSAGNFDAISTLIATVMSNTLLHGQIHLLYPSGEVPEEILEDNTYKAIPFSPHSGAKPEHLKPVSVSTDFWALKNNIEQEISDFYGMGEFSRGQVPREVSSYTVQMAIEMDDKYRIRLFNKKKRGIQKIYRQAISLCKQFVSDNRAMVISGNEGADEYLMFTGQNLEGNYVLRVDYGMYLPADPAARKQQILEVLKLGTVQEAGLDPKKILSILVDGDMFDIKSLAEGARKVQEAENVKLANSIPVPVESYHEHKEHLAAISEYMNSQEFESLDSLIKQKFIEHRKAHVEAQAQLLASSAQQGGGKPNAQQKPKQ
jgi:hypothetical protein